MLYGGRGQGGINSDTNAGLVWGVRNLVLGGGGELMPLPTSKGEHARKK